MSSSTFPDIVLTKIHDFCVANAVIVDGEPVLFKQDVVRLACSIADNGMKPSILFRKAAMQVSNRARVIQGYSGFVRV